MALAAILYNKINMFFLQHYGGAQAVAQYSATWQLVDGISVLASGLLLGNVLFPVFAKLWVKDQQAFASMAQAHVAQLAALALQREPDQLTVGRAHSVALDEDDVARLAALLGPVGRGETLRAQLLGSLLPDLGDRRAGDRRGEECRDGDGENP